MFLPQLQETDSYDVNGKQEDDINSLYEYIDQIVLDNKDDTPEDEDNDNPQDYTVVQVISFYCDQHFFQIEVVVPKIQTTNNFAHSHIDTITSITYDIISPPPEV